MYPWHLCIGVSPAGYHGDLGCDNAGFYHGKHCYLMISYEQSQNSKSGVEPQKMKAETALIVIHCT